MSEFEQSYWADPEFSRGFRDQADNFIVERQRMLAIVQSCFARFLRDEAKRNILDLGCGDGIVTAALVAVDPNVVATLVDGSPDMLAKAEERLAGKIKARFLHASFQDLLRHDPLAESYDFVVSSLAIHHLDLAEKTALFRLIHGHLKPGGCFVNIDVVLAPSKRLEEWYLALWREWIVERNRRIGAAADLYSDITRKYKEEPGNQPSTLVDQLTALHAAGFVEADCFYKYGIFTVFGGWRALAVGGDEE